MKNLTSLLILLFGFSAFSIQGQTPILNEKTIQPYVQAFSIEDNKLIGEGATMLRQFIDESQFFVLGEYHGSHQISKLCTALFPELKTAGYENFAAEVGPYSAKKITELSDEHKEIESTLHAFYTKYYIPEDEDIPVPFFNAIEDAEMLQSAREAGFKLWGLDQEYFSSMFYLYDELLKLGGNDPKLKAMKIKADSVSRKLYLQDIEEKYFKLNEQLMKNEDILAFFEKAKALNPKSSEITEALMKSWEIYRRHELRSLSSHLMRISYMRDNFNNQFSKVPADSKVFVKLGALHTGKNQLGRAYDVGNLTESLAKELGSVSTNVSCDNRYYETDGKIEDSWEERWDKSIQFNFDMLGEKERWKIVNLKAIRKDIEVGKLKLEGDFMFHQFKEKIDNYDVLLITPLDRAATENYDIK